MKKQIFAAVTALCLMATTTLFAQEAKPKEEPKTPPTAEQLAERQTERMTQRLKLTDAQAKQVYQLNLDQIKQMQALREQMNKARMARADKMKSILSTEQFMQWSQMQGPRHGQCGKGMPMKHGKMGQCGNGPRMMQGKKGPHHGDCPMAGKKSCPCKAQAADKQ